MAKARVSTRRAARSSGSEKREGADVSGRAKVVWVSFLGAMTLVGGLLLMLDGRPVPRLDGLSLSPLAATGWVQTEVDPVRITRRPIDRERWQAIVIHHSGSTVGTPASIEAENLSRNIKGLGHHFIIGNGNGMEDGQIHVGYRWLDQLPGAHAAGPNGHAYNLRSISICLVGDGNRRPFTPMQLRQLASLTAGLEKELGIGRERVVLHSDIAPVADPGRLFPVGLVGGGTVAAAGE